MGRHINALVFALVIPDLLLSEQICTSTDYSSCSFAIDQDSFKTNLTDSKSIMAKFKINFVDIYGKKVKYLQTNETILPLDWIVTSSGNLFIKWPVDYWLYSFGLLDSRTYTAEAPVQVIVQNVPACFPVKLGDNATICRLMTAFSRLSIMWEEHEQNKKSTPYWCYYSQYPRVKQSGWYTVGIYFGLTLRMFGFRCCRGIKIKHVVKVTCKDEYDVEMNQCQAFPYYFGVAFFCFFPIMLMKCSARAMKSGRKIKGGKIHQYQDLDDEMNWEYLGKRSPITIAGLFLGVCGLADKHPVIATRIRRVIFVLGLPVLVYAQIAMYHIGWPELVPVIAKRKIPFGFPSILGGIWKSKELFLPVFGGPFFALLVYFTVGIILLILPSDHGKNLEMGLPSDDGTYWSLLCMNIVTIQKYSSKACLGRFGYHKIHAVLRSSVLMLVNPKFWLFALNFQANRWKHLLCKTQRPNRFLTFWLYPLYAVVFILYITLCAAEIVLVIVYYGVPIVMFLIVCERGYARGLQETFRHRRRSVIALFLLITSSLYLYFLFMSCLIILASFHFLSNVIFFLYLAVVIFPNNNFSLVYSFIMLLFFAYRIWGEIEKDYFDLLLETIQAVKHFGDKQKGIQNDITQSGYELVNLFETTGSEVMIRERKNLPGIPKKLYEFVIRKHRPLHITIFLSIIQIALMAFLVLATLVFVSKYVRTIRTEASNELFHVLSVLLITILPNLVHSFFTENIHHKVRRLKMKQTVDEYHQTLL